MRSQTRLDYLINRLGCLLQSKIVANCKAKLLFVAKQIAKQMIKPQ
jgi:hypothetical protein